MSMSGNYGYDGVLLQTDNRELVQCHICGKWFSVLGAHLRKKHSVTQEEYRKEFGLNKRKSLTCDAFSYNQEAKARKYWES